ncbi:MAG: DMT family transporter [Rhodospirillales bacterium]|nr:DMT family transporter [Rhodospirillales bacterium]
MERKTNIPLGIGWMLITLFLFVSMDAIAKYISKDYPIAQIVWARFFFHFVILSILLNRALPTIFKTAKPKLQLFRSALMLGNSFLMITALKYMPLADFSSILLTTPIIVTALSYPLLGERVGVYRWLAVLIGFIGALIVIQPGTDVMTASSLIALASAFCYAFYQIATRKLSSTDSTMTTLLYSGVVGTFVMSIWAPFEWVAPDLVGWLLLSSIGALGALSHWCLIRAFSMAPVAVITPFGYTNIIWATFYGYILFDDLPGIWTITGAAIIISSGLYILYREHRLRGNHNAS